MPRYEHKLGELIVGRNFKERPLLSSDPRIDKLMYGAIRALEVPEEKKRDRSAARAGLEKRLKTKTTFVTKVSGSEKLPERWRVGSRHKTYSDIDAEGNPILENEEGYVLQEGDAVIVNSTLITYPEGHPRAGKNVKGNYDADGNFTVDEEHGNTYLANEYHSKDAEYLYGPIDDSPQPRGYKKIVPTYALKVPERVKKGTTMQTEAGENTLNVEQGGRILFEVKDGKVATQRFITKEYFDDTYAPYADGIQGVQELRDNPVFLDLNVTPNAGSEAASAQ